MGMLKPWHIIVLVVVILLLFGARRLPDLARSVGQSLKIFKKEVKDLTDDGKLNDSNEPPTDSTTSSAGSTTGTTDGSTTRDSTARDEAPPVSSPVDPNAPKA